MVGEYHFLIDGVEGLEGVDDWTEIFLIFLECLLQLLGHVRPSLVEDHSHVSFGFRQ